MNSLLLTLTALVILVLSALFAAPLFIDWNDYRPAIEAQMSKLVGRDVKVGGDVHLIALPAPHFKFDDIKVANADGSLDTPFLEAASLEAKLDVGTLLTGKVEEHQVWQWYRVAGYNLVNRYQGKAWEALARIYPGRADGAWVALSTPYDPLRPDASDAVLAAFTEAMAPSIDRAVDQAVGQAD